MAIIQVNDFGIIRKSAGGLTFRRVGNQIIVSQKITHNKSNTPKQAAGRSEFGTLSVIAKKLKPLVDIGFDPRGSGTRHNAFLHSNSDLRNYLRTQRIAKNQHPPLYYLYKALEDPMFMGHIVSSRGTLNAEANIWLDEEYYPEGMVVLSKEFKFGDRLHLFIIGVYEGRDEFVTMMNTFETVIKPEPPFWQLTTDVFYINRETMPELRPILTGFSTFELIGGVAAAVVLSGKERASSYFSLLNAIDAVYV